MGYSQTHPQALMMQNRAGDGNRGNRPISEAFIYFPALARRCGGQAHCAGPRRRRSLKEYMVVPKFLSSPLPLSFKLLKAFSCLHLSPLCS